MSLAMEASDEAFIAWQHRNLATAARTFGVLVAGPAVFGWRLRSIGALATSRHGDRWLRVVSEYPEYACGDGWTGTIDAGAVTGITKPAVLDMVEWDDDGRRQRAELATFLPGTPVSDTDVAHQAFELSESWWVELRRSLDTLSANDTIRIHTDPDILTARARHTLGRDLPIHRWGTVHGDLHWNNLHSEPFAIIDWELWGRGPVGYDAASLYCHSLLVPDLANQVWDLFADVLDTSEGHIALQAAVVRMLRRITLCGDYLDLESPLRRLAAGLQRPYQ